MFIHLQIVFKIVILSKEITEWICLKYWSMSHYAKAKQTLYWRRSILENLIIQSILVTTRAQINKHANEESCHGLNINVHDF